MTIIFFVRHGETDWNATRRIQGREDVPLNDNGKKQAQECGDYLKDFDFEVIITSPMTRAKQTAEYINEHFTFPTLIEMEEFMERDYGIVSGLSIDEKIKQFPNEDHPSVESQDALRQRVMKGISTIHERYQGKNVLVVAHGGLINALLGTLSNGEIGTGKTKLMNGSVTKIRFDQDTWVIDEYNQVNHLTYMMVHR